MDIKSLTESIASVAKPTEAKAAKRHYPCFNGAEWAVVCKAFGPDVTPDLVKRIVLGIASGQLEVRPKAT